MRKYNVATSQRLVMGAEPTMGGGEVGAPLEIVPLFNFDVGWRRASQGVLASPIQKLPRIHRKGNNPRSINSAPLVQQSARNSTCGTLCAQKFGNKNDGF